MARSGRRGLTVHLDLVIEGVCPTAHREAVMRAAPEMIANAIVHGFYQRQQGRIDLRLSPADARGTRLDISDDGWGFAGGEVAEGRGFRLLRSLGEVSLSTRAKETERRTTTVSLTIPPPGLAG